MSKARTELEVSAHDEEAEIRSSDGSGNPEGGSGLEGIDFSKLREELGLQGEPMFEDRVEATQLLEVFISLHVKKIGQSIEKLWTRAKGSEFLLLDLYINEMSDDVISDEMQKLYNLFFKLNGSARDRITYCLQNDSIQEVLEHSGIGTGELQESFIKSVFFLINVGGVTSELGLLVDIGEKQEDKETTPMRSAEALEIIQKIHQRYAAVINRIEKASEIQEAVYEKEGIRSHRYTYLDWLKDFRVKAKKAYNFPSQASMNGEGITAEGFTMSEQLTSLSAAEQKDPAHIEREIMAVADMLERNASGDYALSFLLIDLDYFSAFSHFLNHHAEVLSEPHSETSKALEIWLREIEENEEDLDTTMVEWTRKRLSDLRANQGRASHETEREERESRGQAMMETLGLPSQWAGQFFEERQQMGELILRGAVVFRALVKLLPERSLKGKTANKLAACLLAKIHNIDKLITESDGESQTLTKLVSESDIPQEDFDLYLAFRSFSDHFGSFEPVGRLMFHLDAGLVQDTIPDFFPDDQDKNKTAISVCREMLTAYLFVQSLTETVSRVVPRESQPAKVTVNKRHTLGEVQNCMRTHWNNFQVLDAFEPNEKKAGESFRDPLKKYSDRLFAEVLYVFGAEMQNAMRRQIPLRMIKTPESLKLSPSLIPELEDIFRFDATGQLTGYDLRKLTITPSSVPMDPNMPELVSCFEGEFTDEAIREQRLKGYLWFIWHVMVTQLPAIFCSFESNSNMRQLFEDLDQWMDALPEGQEGAVCEILIRYYGWLKKENIDIVPVDIIKQRIANYRKRKRSQRRNGSSVESQSEKSGGSTELPKLKISSAVNVTRYDVVCTLEANQDAEVQVAIRSAGNGEVLSQTHSLVAGTAEQVETTLVPGIYVVEVASEGASIGEKEIVIGCPKPRITDEERLADQIMNATEGAEVVTIDLENEIVDWSEVSLSIKDSRRETHVLQVSEDGSVTVPNQLVREIQQNRFLNFSFRTTDGLKSPDLQIDLPLPAPKIANVEALRASLKENKKGSFTLGNPIPRGAKLWKRITKVDLHRVGQVLREGAYEEVSVSDELSGEIEVNGWKQTGTKLDITFAYGWTAQDAKEAQETASFEVEYRKEKKSAQVLPTPNITLSSEAEAISPEEDLSIKITDIPEIRGLNLQIDTGDGWSRLCKMTEVTDGNISLPKPTKSGSYTWKLRYTAGRGKPTEHPASITFEYIIPVDEGITEVTSESVGDSPDENSGEPEKPPVVLSKEAVEAWQLALTEEEEIINNSEFRADDQSIMLSLPSDVAQECEIENPPEIELRGVSVSGDMAEASIVPQEFGVLRTEILPIAERVLSKKIQVELENIASMLPGEDFESDDWEYGSEKFCNQEGIPKLWDGAVWYEDIVPLLRQATKEIPANEVKINIYPKRRRVGLITMDIRILGSVVRLEATVDRNGISWRVGENALGNEKDSLTKISRSAELVKSGKKVNGVDPEQELVAFGEPWTSNIRGLQAYMMELVTQAGNHAKQQHLLDQETKSAAREMRESSSADREKYKILAYKRFSKPRTKEEGAIIYPGEYLPKDQRYNFAGLRKLGNKTKKDGGVILRDACVVVREGSKIQGQYEKLRSIDIYREIMRDQCVTHCNLEAIRSGFSNETASEQCWATFDETVGEKLKEESVLAEIRQHPDASSLSLSDEDSQLRDQIQGALRHPGSQEIPQKQALAVRKILRETAIGKFMKNPNGAFVDRVIKKFDDAGLQVQCHFYLTMPIGEFIDEENDLAEKAKSE